MRHCIANLLHNHQEKWQYTSWAAEKAFRRVEIYQEVKITDVDRNDERERLATGRNANQRAQPLLGNQAGIW